MSDTEGATISATEAKISQIIKDLSTESSFSAEAMRQFMELREEVQSQESTIRYLRTNNKEKDEAIKEGQRAGKILLADLNLANEELAGFRVRISELEDREKQCAINEVRMECANARVEDHQGMVGLIFRNTELRRQTMGERGMPQTDGGWAPTANLSETETEE
jgi:hypothetical protein